MLKTVTGFWLRIIAHDSFLVELTTDPFPPGTNVYANISLNELNTYFLADSAPNTKFSATGYISFWTYYQADGTESEPQQSMGFNQNAVAVNNCARINFVLEGIQVTTAALVNIFTY